jgi:hypothetical protein
MSSCSQKVDFNNHKVTYNDLIGTSWEKIDSSSIVQHVSVIHKFEDSTHLNWKVNGADVAKFRYYLDTSTNITVLHVLELYKGSTNRDDTFLIKLVNYNTIKTQWPFEKNKWNNKENSDNTEIMNRKPEN